MRLAHHSHHSNLNKIQLGLTGVCIQDLWALTPLAVLTGLAFSLGIKAGFISSGTLAMMSTSLGDCFSLLRLHTLARTAFSETETPCSWAWLSSCTISLQLFRGDGGERKSQWIVFGLSLTSGLEPLGLRDSNHGHFCKRLDIVSKNGDLTWSHGGKRKIKMMAAAAQTNAVSLAPTEV